VSTDGAGRASVYQRGTADPGPRRHDAAAVHPVVGGSHRVEDSQGSA